MNLIKKLHQSGTVCCHHGDPEKIITTFLSFNLPLDDELKSLIEKRPKMALKDLVPCHLDLHAGNILDDGERHWIIDWEYGGI